MTALEALVDLLAEGKVEKFPAPLYGLAKEEASRGEGTPHQLEVLESARLWNLALMNKLVSDATRGKLDALTLDED